MASAHKHRRAHERDVAYSGPVVGDATQQNRAAHGCITRIVTCSCGAQKRVNINGWHTEHGPWVKWEDDDEQ